MAGNKQKKSSFSLFNIIKSRRSRRSEEAWDDVGSTARKIYPSDEDKGRWVADPGIDRKASAFIAKFHEARVSESELYAVYQATKA